ncbi:hypothetical protein PMAYCL1PPCAC_01093, partial [Pristionchus mayeri]
LLMTTLYNLTIPTIGLNVQVTYLESKIREIPPDTIFFYITIMNYTIEMILLVTTYAILGPAILTFWKSAKLHENLKRITVTFLCHIVLYSLLRSIIFLYQIQALHLSGDFSADYPFVIAHFARVYHVYSAYSGMMAFALERSAATFMVKDYEV